LHHGKEKKPFSGVPVDIPCVAIGIPQKIFADIGMLKILINCVLLNGASVLYGIFF
jgi:hypothetical protein